MTDKLPDIGTVSFTPGSGFLTVEIRSHEGDSFKTVLTTDEYNAFIAARKLKIPLQFALPHFDEKRIRGLSTGRID